MMFFRTLRSLSNSGSHRGFTLVELAVSILILGSALTTLVTLQSSHLKAYLHERNLMKAALYAQYLMTMLEVGTEPPEYGEEAGKLSEALDEVGYFSDEQMNTEKTDLESWEYVQRVSRFIEDETRDEDRVRRIDLEVRWGPGAGETFSVVYYMRTKENP